MKAVSGSFSVARRGTKKCNFTAAPQAGKERFLYLFQIKLLVLQQYMQKSYDFEKSMKLFLGKKRFKLIHLFISFIRIVDTSTETL